MRFVDVIARKRDGQALLRADIDGFVEGATTGTLPDYQIAALLMAIVLRGMSEAETAWLTDAMLRSGERVDLSHLPGTPVGKHSTGGVGDKVSIALVPLVAACGVTVPKMSGRGLGHTGGTLDKLESIPGFRVNVPLQEFRRLLETVGCAIVGQTPSLAPADKTLYALRDVTATVESVPLICASIMSKKLAEGSRALVLDVKCGSGAFMQTPAAARDLAAALVATGARAGVRTEAFVTRMDLPLGRTVGNALEIAETIELLKGSGPLDLATMIVRLATRMVVLSGRAEEAAAQDVRQALASGAAFEKLREMVTHQGGDARVLDDPTLLPRARRRVPVRAERSGFVTRMHAGLIGRAARLLGAGRAQVGDAIDYAAGVAIARTAGEPVHAGDILLELCGDDARGLDEAQALAAQAITVADDPPPAAPLVMEWIG